MITHIIKRDGRKVKFDISKITAAIYQAASSIGGRDEITAAVLAGEVVAYLQEKQITIPTVEQIQDAVEHILISRGHERTAKCFILYRANRTRIREKKTRLMEIYKGLTFQEATENDLKRENANINGDTAMGAMLKYGSEGSKEFFSMFVIDPKYSKAHQDGDIHIHDMDFYTLTTTCCQIDLSALFRRGFSTGHGHLRQPKSILSYASLACIAIQANQNDQHGGQSIPKFDYDMAEGVFYSFKKIYLRNLQKALEAFLDHEISLETIKQYVESHPELTPTLANSHFTELLQELGITGKDSSLLQKIEKFVYHHSLEEIENETYQAMEALIHNLNTMNSRAGAQVPFSSLNYGTDTSPEGRLVMRCLLEATEAGLGNGETPIFPIQIFKVKEGINFNPEDPNYDLFRLACRVSAKRLFPNFSFIDSPFNKHYYKEGHPETEVAYMGCRTRVIGNIYDPTNEIVTGRGNLSFTSLNLPRLAIKANKNIDFFFEMLEDKINLIAGQLMERYKIQAMKKVRNYPFLMQQGIWLGSEKLGLNDNVGEVLKHGTLSLGFIGLAECLKALTGFHHGESDNSQQLGLEIVSFMRRKMDSLSESSGFNYTLIGTPAEGLSGRFIKLDRQKYGVIDGVTGKEYYTNSFHVPVYYNTSITHKLDIEAPYHALTNAGHISYVELNGNPGQNLEAFEKIIRYMKEKGIGYGSINHPIDRDPVCGYTGIIENECPQCHRKEDDHLPKFERIRRITGYLVGTLDRFNDAKKAEESERVKHN